MPSSQKRRGRFGSLPTQGTSRGTMEVHDRGAGLGDLRVQSGDFSGDSGAGGDFGGVSDSGTGCDLDRDGWVDDSGAGAGLLRAAIYARAGIRVLVEIIFLFTNGLQAEAVVPDLVATCQKMPTSSSSFQLDSWK